MKSIRFVAFVFLAVNASAQIKSTRGTILVAMLTKNEFTIAEDSRVKDWDSGRYIDNDCKIITLGHKVLFGFTGTRSFDVPTKRFPISWEAHAAAIRAYKTAPKKTALSTAKQFVILAKRAFGDAIKVMGWREFSKQTGTDEGLAGAIFADADSSGQPEEFKVSLWYSIPKGTIEPEIKPMLPDPVDHYNLWVDGSDTSVATEFAKSLTFRADMEVKRWKQGISGKEFEETMSLFGIQLAKWEVMYTKDPSIGGEIDSMELTRTGIADHRKPSCQNNK